MDDRKINVDLQKHLEEYSKAKFGVPTNETKEFECPKIEKNILHRLDFKKAPVVEIENGIHTISRNIVVDHIKNVDEAVIKEMYKIYNLLGVNELILIDETEFEKFIRKYLPIYAAERGLL